MRKISIAVCALLVGLGSAVQADTIQDWSLIGTEELSTDRTVTQYFNIGLLGSYGVLNQTDGTLSASAYGLIIGHAPSISGVCGAYYMSGDAQFTTIGTVVLGNDPRDGAQNSVSTWSLADSASATMGTLSFAQASNAYTYGSRYVLLSGAASLNAASLAFYGTSVNYISFASGSTATFTASDKGLADYQALVAAGNIRVDGVAQTDFSAFQVVGNTLSVIPEPATLSMIGVMGIAMLLRRRFVKQ